MRKKLRLLVLVSAFAIITSLTNCHEDECTAPVCAGCDDDAPWSASCSDQCYFSFEDCDASERGDCTVCN